MIMVGRDLASRQEIQKKIEEEMAKREADSVLYWKGEIEKILNKRNQSLGGLQLEIQNLAQRMQNRIKILKGFGGK
jgi:hypothetical protein